MNIQAPFISPEVEAAAASTRTEAEARAQRDGSNVVRLPVAPDPFVTADIYQIIATPRSGESFAVETEWPVMTSKRMTLAHLQDVIWGDCTARVILRKAEGGAEDVSEDFARDFARQMFEGGSDIDACIDIRFISSHLTNREIAECRR